MIDHREPGVAAPALRLVGGTSWRDGREPAQKRHIVEMALLSARAENAADMTGLHGLALELEPGQCLVFSHARLRPSTDSNLPGALRMSYAFSVQVEGDCEASVSASGKRVHTALSTLAPSMHLQLPRPIASDALDYTWHAHPAGLVARPAISLRHAAARPAGGCSGDVSSGVSAESWPMPFSGTLPGWVFTALLEPSAQWAQQVLVRVVLCASRPAQAERRAREQLLQRLLGGALVAYPPTAVYEPYAAASESMASESTHHLRQTLAEPDVPLVALSVEVSASSALPQVLLRRIFGDVFGKVRFMHKAGPLREGWPSSPALSHTVRAQQGMPAVLPSLVKLHCAGVPIHYLPPEMSPPAAGGAVVGHTVCGAESTAVAIPDAARTRHLCVFGATGSGKSSLLMALLAADMASEHRPGLLVLDPHGELVEQALALVPHDRLSDVVLIDAADETHCASLNLMAGTKDLAHANFVADQVLDLVDVLFETRDSSGPVTRSHLRATLMLATFVSERDPTFLDAMRILEDKDYRDWLLSKCTLRELTTQWEQFTKSSGDHGFATWLPYLRPRLQPFSGTPAMRRLFNRPAAGVSLDECLREGRIVFINLSKAVLGELGSRVAGNMILTQLFAAALRRARAPASDHRPMYVVGDEFHNFATRATTTLFAEARKFGVGVTAACQTTAQLRTSGRESLADEILGNTATRILFRLGPADGAALSSYYGPTLKAEDMATLPDFHAAISMPVQGKLLPPFVARFARPSHDSRLHARPEAVRGASNAQHAIPVAQANEEIASTFDLVMGGTQRG